MLNNKRIGVVISAFNEEKQITDVLETIPDFIDRVIIVDDCSTDGTVEKCLPFLRKGDGQGVLLKQRAAFLDSRVSINGRYHRAEEMKFEIFKEEGEKLTPREELNTHPETDRFILISHKINRGKGAALASGLYWCRDYGMDCTVTIDGDGQMDPGEMERLAGPVVFDQIDYVKGNRLSHRAALRIVPKVRYFGNSILSILTKIASGYWTVWDAQTGYTALSLRALDALEMQKIYPRYGVPNDLLVKMNIANCTLREVAIKPVYRIGETSKMSVLGVIPKIGFLLMRLFFERLWKKYFFRSFHPLFLLYHLSICLFAVEIPAFLEVIREVFISGHKMPVGNYLAFVLIFIIAFQSLLFAMWMDIQDNANLVRP